MTTREPGPEDTNDSKPQAGIDTGQTGTTSVPDFDDSLTEEQRQELYERGKREEAMKRYAQQNGISEGEAAKLWGDDKFEEPSPQQAPDNIFSNQAGTLYRTADAEGDRTPLERNAPPIETRVPDQELSNDPDDTGLRRDRNDRDARNDTLEASVTDADREELERRQREGGNGDAGNAIVDFDVREGTLDDFKGRGDLTREQLAEVRRQEEARENGPRVGILEEIERREKALD